MATTNQPREEATMTNAPSQIAQAKLLKWRLTGVLVNQ